MFFFFLGEQLAHGAAVPGGVGLPVDLPRTLRAELHHEGWRVGRLLPEQPLLDHLQAEAGELGPTRCQIKVRVLAQALLSFFHA